MDDIDVKRELLRYLERERTLKEILQNIRHQNTISVLSELTENFNPTMV